MANRRFETYQYRRIIDAYAVGRVGSCDRPFRVDGTPEDQRLSACVNADRRFVRWQAVSVLQ